MSVFLIIVSCVVCLLLILVGVYLSMSKGIHKTSPIPLEKAKDGDYAIEKIEKKTEDDSVLLHVRKIESSSKEQQKIIFSTKTLPPANSGLLDVANGECKFYPSPLIW